MKVNISVIIPTTGRSSLSRAIESVALQKTSFELETEILVIDDSASQQINQECYVVLKTGGNKGVSFSRNLGIQNSKYDLIAFLDDDDIWHNYHLEEILHFMQRDKLDVAISSAYLVKNGMTRPKKFLEIGTDPFELLYGRVHLFYSPGYLPTSGYVLDREILNDLKFNVELVDRENIDLLHQIFLKGGKIAQSQEATISIDYNSKSSISRANYESELAWLFYLKEINRRYAYNFKLESSRNLFRKKSFLKSLLILFK